MGAAGTPAGGGETYTRSFFSQKNACRVAGPPRVTSASPPSSPTTTSRVRNRSTTQNRAAASAKRRSRFAVISRGSSAHATRTAAANSGRRSESAIDSASGHSAAPSHVMPRRDDAETTGAEAAADADARVGVVGGLAAKFTGDASAGGERGDAGDDAYASSEGTSSEDASSTEGFRFRSWS